VHAQVEADIRPFRSLLLGLFFVTTGSSLDLALFVQQWPIVLVLLAGLLSVKIGIIGSISPMFGLTRCDLNWGLPQSRSCASSSCTCRTEGLRRCCLC
jgi:Kef-type K+ transport system membrane component KefB